MYSFTNLDTTKKHKEKSKQLEYRVRNSCHTMKGIF